MNSGVMAVMTTTTLITPKMVCNKNPAFQLSWLSMVSMSLLNLFMIRPTGVWDENANSIKIN